ncbi:MAG: hypothetical protein NTY99_00795, partial [DPANN group archaeon]|nr:hypothetical protein [DPANN group archaeon]
VLMPLFAEKHTIPKEENKMENKQDKYDPKICEPLFRLMQSGKLYELKKSSVHCIDCSNYEMIGGAEFCSKASDLEKIAKDEKPQVKDAPGWDTDEAYKSKPYDNSVGWKNPLGNGQ